MRFRAVVISILFILLACIVWLSFSRSDEKAFVSSDYAIATFNATSGYFSLPLDKYPLRIGRSRSFSFRANAVSLREVVFYYHLDHDLARSSSSSCREPVSINLRLYSAEKFFLGTLHILTDLKEAGVSSYSLPAALHLSSDQEWFIDIDPGDLGDNGKFNKCIVLEAELRFKKDTPWIKW